MKITYNGITYNTDTAIKLLWRCNNLSENDFGFVEEWLCATPSGDYFLAGHGGARTKYAHRLSDGSFRAGDDIIPLTEQEMAIWLCDHYGDEDLIEKWKEILKKVSEYVGKEEKENKK